MAIPIQVTFDCADPERVASFWAEALGYKLQDPPEGYANWPDFLTAIGVREAEWNKASAIVDPEGRGPRIYFQRVPESKVVKNRVHLDVTVGGGPGTRQTSGAPGSRPPLSGSVALAPPGSVPTKS